MGGSNEVTEVAAVDGPEKGLRRAEPNDAFENDEEREEGVLEEDDAGPEDPLEKRGAMSGVRELNGSPGLWDDDLRRLLAVDGASGGNGG